MKLIYGLLTSIIIALAFISFTSAIVPTWSGTLKNNITYHYSFEETTGIFNNDVYNYRYNSTNAQIVTRTTGKIGNAVLYNTTGESYTRVNQTTHLADSNINYTIGFWVKGYPQPADYDLYSEGSSSSATQFFVLRASNGGSGTYKYLSIVQRTDASVLTTVTLDTGIIFDNTWHYVILCNDQGTYTYYIDSILNKTGTYTKGTKTLNLATIGRLIRNTVDANGINATIDEWSVWNRTLTQSEVTQLYNNGLGLYFADSGASQITELSHSINSTAYETSSNNYYAINVSLNSNITSISANLYVNDVQVSTSKIGDSNGTLFYSYYTIPSNNYGSKTIYWLYTYTNSSGTFIESSTNYTQTFSPINFTLCDAAVTIPFLNITFKDESTLLKMNASIPTFSITYYIGDGTQTKTYTFINSTENQDYPFCFSPADRTLSNSLTMTYSASGYPTRPYISSSNLSNTTTNTVLYLLSSADGIYSSIQTSESSGINIQGVNLLVERQIGTTWTMVGQATTDNSGLATFWVNPNYPHRITASKNGYVTQQLTISPTQSVYTILMSRSSGNATYTGPVQGMKWFIIPQSGYVGVGTKSFGFNLTASSGNLESCKMELINATGSILSSAIGGSPYGCNLSISYAVTLNQKIFGRLSVDTTESQGYFVLDSDAKWFNFESNISTSGTLKDFFDSVTHLRDLGEGYRQEYSRIVWFFLIVTILLSIFTLFTGAELTNPGTNMTLLTGIIFIASYSGFFTLEFGNQYMPGWFAKYWAFIMSMLFTIGILGTSIRRNG